MSKSNNSNQMLNIEQMFTHLKLQWQAPSPKTNQGFTALSNKLAHLMSELQHSQSLKFLDKQFYPEWRVLNRKDINIAINHQSIFSLPDTDSDDFRNGFYFCNRLIQLMEDVYLDLDLEAFSDHPDNRGWINLFRHWSWSPMFQASWTISACTFGIRFQRFCRQKLNLELGNVITKSIDFSEIDVSTLNAFELLQVKKIYQVYQQQKVDLELYSMDLRVASPLTSSDQEQFLLPVFNFGYAMTISHLKSKSILMFRVQDHLRKLGLGNAALFHLVSVMEEQSRTDRMESLSLDPGYLRIFGLTTDREDIDKTNKSTISTNDYLIKIMSDPLFKREVSKQSVAQFLRMLDSAKAKYTSRLSSSHVVA